MSITILSSLLSSARKVKTVAINIVGHENRGMALFIMLLLLFTGVTCAVASSRLRSGSFAASKTVQSLPVGSGHCSAGQGQRAGMRDWAFDLFTNVN